MIAVLTCDIIGSRFFSNKDRALLQKSIREFFDVTCRLFPQAKADVISFRVTAGDEFQFSLLEPCYSYQFLLHLRLQTSLLKVDRMPLFRCGIGTGERSVEGQTSYEMDGTAYYRSRQALSAISDSAVNDRLTSIVTPNEQLNKYLSGLLPLLDIFENEWSMRQREFILHQMEGRNVMDTAVEIDTSHQNVSKALKTANWDEFKAGIELIQGFIKDAT